MTEILPNSALSAIVEVLGVIRIGAAPPKEKDIESVVLQTLSSVFARANPHAWRVERQWVTKQNRFDLCLVSEKIRTRIVIEVKKLASVSCVAQLDRYSSQVDGLILVCWRATEPLKEIIQTAKCSIPVALIQLKQRAPIVP